MGISAEQYANQLASLLPSGQAWDNDKRSSLMGRLLKAFALELARIDLRGEDLMNELDPRTTLELLPDWERVLGLPDPCLSQAGTLAQRRQAVTTKLTLIGGQSKQFFIDLAAGLGYTITITEFYPFVAGSDVGDELYNSDEWRYTWQINAPETTITEFRVGQSTTGEALREWGNEQLECAMNLRKPAHTNLLFAYGNE